MPSIPRRCLNGLLIAVFAAVLLFPHFQKRTQIPPDMRLGGIRNRVREFPRLTPMSWLRGEFASTIEAWTGENIGMRGWLVHLNRQIRYSLFGQVEASPLRRRALVIGKAPILYENILVVDALRTPQITPEKMEAFAASLARTQALLKEQGMAFLVVLAPNKAIVQPEALPGWARHRVPGKEYDYIQFVAALQRHEVPVLDTVTLFQELGSALPDLIPPHGIHWSHHGAWIALQHAIPLINRQGILPEIQVPATEELIWDKPSGMNDELRGQLNLFFSDHGDAIPSAYPVAAPPPPGSESMLSALIVGDSFALTFMDALSRSGLCRTIHLWFYMIRGKEATPSFDSRQHRGIPRIGGMDIGRGSNENVIRMLEGKNLVLLVITTFNIDKYSWRFDRLVRRIYGEPDVEPAPDEEIEVDFEN